MSLNDAVARLGRKCPFLVYPISCSYWWATNFFSPSITVCMLPNSHAATPHVELLFWNMHILKLCPSWCWPTYWETQNATKPLLPSSSGVPHHSRILFLLTVIWYIVGVCIGSNSNTPILIRISLERSQLSTQKPVPDKPVCYRICNCVFDSGVRSHVTTSKSKASTQVVCCIL